MNAIQLNVVATVSAASATPLAAPAAGTASLLPEPSVDTNLDAMSALYALMSEQRRVNADKSKGDAEGLLEKKKFFRERAIEALKKAEEELEDGGVFGDIGKKLGTVGKIAAIAGAAALIVGTAGTGAVALAIAAAVLSTAAFAQSETRYLQELGVDDKTAMYMELGMVAGSALCSGGAGLAAVANAGSSTATTVTAFEKGAKIVGAAATITSGATGAAGAYAGWQQGVHEANAEEHLADAAGERASQDRMQRLLLRLIDEIEDSEKRDERTLGHLRGAIEAKGVALVMASTRV